MKLVKFALIIIEIKITWLISPESIANLKLVGSSPWFKTTWFWISAFFCPPLGFEILGKKLFYILNLFFLNWGHLMHYQTTGWQCEKAIQPKSTSSMWSMRRRRSYQTHLVNEEGGEAKDGLLLDNRAFFLQAGHLQLPGGEKLEYSFLYP